MPWGLFFVCLGYYITAGLAVSLTYHRLLTHRSFHLWKPLERLFVTLALPAGTPIQWVGNHRQHHAHTDQTLDPHAPAHGFWHAHNGWYIDAKSPLVCVPYALAGPLRVLFDGWHRPRNNQQYNHLAKDVAADPYYSWISRPGPYFVANTLHVLVPFTAVTALFGPTGLGAFWATLVVIVNLGDAVDSVGHMLGDRPYPNAGQARNHWFLGALAFGDGWHANHHRFPRSARHGFARRQFDLTWQFIRLFAWLGLAKDVRLPSLRAISTATNNKAKAHGYV